MIGYKLFRELKNGAISPLFINRKQRLQTGVWYEAEEHRTPGFTFRPGWHICEKPEAPHLSKRGRAWYKVEFEEKERLDRPESQGGVWYLGSKMKILERLSS